MRVSFPKGVGNALLNAVRASSFMNCIVARPVAFKIGSQSSILDTPAGVVEDMTTFISTVSSATFVASKGDKLIVAEHSFNGELKLSELLKGTGITADRDCIILHSFEEVTVSVVFLQDAGVSLGTWNAELLSQHGLDGYAAINSRHCAVESFTFYPIGEDDSTETFEVVLQTADGASESTVLRDAIDGVIKNCKIFASRIG